jgi:hypothetical protein
MINTKLNSWLMSQTAEQSDTFVPGWPFFGAEVCSGWPFFGAEVCSGWPFFGAEFCSGWPVFGAEFCSGWPLFGADYYEKFWEKAIFEGENELSWFFHYGFWGHQTYPFNILKNFPRWQDPFNKN